ncbi:unnamed protein product, partial [Adineta ricciae]
MLQATIVEMKHDIPLKIESSKEKKMPGYTKDLFMANMNRRLAVRKLLHNRLSITTDVMCAISIVSIILMIIANEIAFNQPGEFDTVAGWFVKLIITILTAVLLILVLVYHRLDLDLYSINNSIDNWCVGLTHQRLFIVVAELMICAIHPMPRSYP